MEKQIKYIVLGLVFFGLYLSGCRYDTKIAHPEKFVNVYMSQAVGEPDVHTLEMLDTAQTLIYGASYGGTKYPSSDIKVIFNPEPSLVQEYNSEHHTSYLSLPEGSYELEANSAIIPKGELSTKPLALSVSTYGVLQPNVKYLLPIRVSTNKESLVNKDLGVTYFIIQAKYDIISVSMSEGNKDSAIYTFDMADTAQSIFYSAQYEAVDTVNKDISVSFGVNPDLVDSFNTKYGTNYPILPMGSYDLTTKNTTIFKGDKKTAKLSLKIKTKQVLDNFKKYLLPVQIISATGDLEHSKKIVIDEQRKTAFFIVEALPVGGIELTIMSYGKNSGDNDLQALADLISQYDPDLLYIRQLDKNTSRSGPTNQPQVVSQLLGMPHYIFFKGLDYQGGYYGDGLYSKFPLVASETKTHELYSSGSEQGTLGIVQLKIQDSLRLYFAGTHLNAGYDTKMSQTAELLGYMDDYNAPLILAGAFNGRPNGDYDNMNDLQDQFTFPCTSCSIYDQYIMYKPGNDFQVLEYKEISIDEITKYTIFLLKLKWYP